MDDKIKMSIFLNHKLTVCNINCGCKDSYYFKRSIYILNTQQKILLYWQHTNQ